MKGIYVFTFLTCITYARAVSLTPPQSNSAHLLSQDVESTNCSLTPTDPSEYWLEGISHEGTSPFLLGGGSWTVFRNVMDYGAKGDGTTDDTAAIQNAMNDGGRQNHDGGTTRKPALVYFPSGTYMVNTTIQMWLMTQIVGNPLNPPRLKATSTFSSSFPISSGSSTEINLLLNGWDLTDGSTLNFYIGVRNIILDTTGFPASGQMTALNWAVSQGTSLYNVQINMPDSSQHYGIEMLSNTGCCGGGSGTMLGDLTITGGLVGIHLSGQQYLFKSITFDGCNTAIKVDSQFFATFIDMTFENGATAIDVSNCNTGDISLIDSSATFIGVVVNACSSQSGQGSVLIENFQNINSGPTVKAGSSILLLGSMAGTWVTGNVYIDNTNNPEVDHKQTETLPSTKKPEALLVNGTGKYLTKVPPQYEQYNSSQFTSVKDFGAVGDGKVDDTAAITAALLANAGCQITYFPYGVYLVTDTIYVPPGSRLIGEVWSVISAANENFANASSPIPLLQVGNPGDVGVAELSDLVLTTSDILPGAILLQIHMSGANPGDVSTSNVHIRIGGAADTLIDSVCDTTPEQCLAAFLAVHITPSGSPYIENMWAWTADHSLDGGVSSVVATGRGFLIESTEAAWLMGTASEHHTLYAYNVVGAQNAVFFFQQIETPYWEPSIGAPSIWTPDTTTWSDPDFSNCASTDLLCQMSWGMVISGGSGIIVYGSGVWTFFDDRGSCTGPNGACQENAYKIDSSPTETYLYCLNSKDITNLVFGQTASGDEGVLAATLNNPGGWGADLAAYLGFSENTTSSSSSNIGIGSTIFVQPSIWSEPNPTLACSPPCILILPPSPLPTPTTLTWPPVVTPLLSLSGDTTVTVITTITVSAFTISYVPFWAVTIASDDGTNLTAFTPVQSIMPPSIIFDLPGDETLSPIPSFTYVPWLTTTVGEIVTPIPTPIQNGTVAECTFFYQAEPGDNCTSIAAEVLISLDTFVQWNPAVNADCSGLIVGDWYCVAVVQNVTQTPVPPVYLTTPSFYSTSHLVTIQPPPTVSFTFTPSPLTFSATPSPVSSSGPCDGIIKAAACGAAACAIFGCPDSTSGCGEFGCDGGCGITFCGGGCALLDCGPGCGEGDCAASSGGSGFIPPIGTVPSETSGSSSKTKSCNRMPTSITSFSFTPTSNPSATTTATSSPSCPTSLSCDSNGCLGSFDTDEQATCKGNFAGCACVSGSDTCGAPESCDADDCDGKFMGNTPFPVCTSNLTGCQCIPGSDTCSPPQSCDAGGCAGKFIGETPFPTCTNNFVGCKCTPQSDTCGPAQSCDAGGCAGKFLGDTPDPVCTGNFLGCKCLPQSNTCGPAQSCDAGGCAGKFLGNTPDPVCTGNFVGCNCIPQSDTCGPVQSCDAGGCAGQFLGNVPTPQCIGNFVSCDCIPQGDTCGIPKSCTENGCNGQFLGSVPNPTCTGNFVSCQCIPQSATCGPLASCTMDGCNGQFLGNVPTPQCIGNFLGCDCIPQSETCGPAKSCSLNGCAGSINTDGKATCKGNFLGCECLPPPPGCGPIGPCSFAACNGIAPAGSTLGTCTGSLAGCICAVTSSAPPTSSTLPTQPPPPPPLETVSVIAYSGLECSSGGSSVVFNGQLTVGQCFPQTSSSWIIPSLNAGCGVIVYFDSGCSVKATVQEDPNECLSSSEIPFGSFHAFCH